MLLEPMSIATLGKGLNALFDKFELQPSSQ